MCEPLITRAMCAAKHPIPLRHIAWPQTSGCCSVEADEREPNSLRTLPHSLFCAPPDPHIGRLSIGPFHPTKPILIYALSYKLPPIRRSQQQELSWGHWCSDVSRFSFILPVFLYIGPSNPPIQYFSSPVCPRFLRFFPTKEGWRRF